MTSYFVAWKALNFVAQNGEYKLANRCTSRAANKRLIVKICLNFNFIFFQTNENNPYPPGVVMFTPNSNGHLNLNVEFQPHDDSNPTRTFVVGGRKKQSSLNFAVIPPGSANGSGSQMTSRSEWPTRHRDGRLVERPSIPGASSNSSVKRNTGVSVVCDATGHTTSMLLARL